VSFIKNVGMLFIAAVTLSACANSGPEVTGMPSDNDWAHVLITSKPAYAMAGCSGGCMPTDAVWNAVLKEDRKETQQETASPAQLNVDIKIGQLLREAREAIAANDAVKIQEIGAKLQADLDQRMQINREFENKYAQKHPFVALPSVGSVPLADCGNTSLRRHPKGQFKRC
jgi:hypothetical protein